jgi:ferredoxin
MALHVEIDRDVCMGSGSCVFQAPGAFALDDDGIAVVVDPAAAPEDTIRAAAARCPSRAITVTSE